LKKGITLGVLLALRWQVSAVMSSDKGSGPLRVFRVETYLSLMVARLVTS
jgi:adenine/guanine phosphoribosyltransferase-like PRPP-binding protein